MKDKKTIEAFMAYSIIATLSLMMWVGMSFPSPQALPLLLAILFSWLTLVVLSSSII